MISIATLTPGDFNTGSLRDILFIPTQMVDEILYPVNGILPADALRWDGAAVSLFNLKFTEETASLSYDQNITASGNIYKTRINASVPKDYQFRPSDFNLLDTLRFFVITRDSNNRSRLHGYINPQGEKYGMKLTVDFDTSKSRTGYNGYKIEFALDSIQRPYPIADPSGITINPGGGGPVQDTDPNPGNIE